MEVLVAMLLILILGVAFVGWCEAKRRGADEARLRALKLSDIDSMDGITFEHYVAKLLRNEGYTKIDVLRASGDFGVDIKACKGRRWYAIQVKRWSGMVSRTAVSDAVAAKDHYSCNAAMVVTNSYLSAKAKQFASSVGCEVVERDTLSEWILRYQGPGSRATTSPTRVSALARVPSQPETPPRGPWPHPPARPRSSDAEESVPPNVFQAIKKLALTDHPGDFSTQLYVIGEQTKSYTRLQSFKPSGIPGDILEKMVYQAAEDHPSDYSTQLFVVEDSVGAYFALAKLSDRHVPIPTIAAIKREAELRHPWDFSTQLYVVKEQLEAYKSLGHVGQETELDRPTSA